MENLGAIPQLSQQSSNGRHHSAGLPLREIIFEVSMKIAAVSDLSQRRF